MNFILQINNNIIGSFSTFNKAYDFIIAGYNHNFFSDNVTIHCYKKNSCYRVFSHIITKQPVIEHTLEELVIEKPIEFEKTKELTKEELEELDKIAKEKIELQHNINLLKCEKEKLKELKQQYEIDINLFNLITEELNSKIIDKIPELFDDKYKIIKKLKETNELNFDNFNRLYKRLNTYEEFTSNSYDKKFENDVEEEYEI